MKTAPLAPDELDMWHRWKRASEAVMAKVEHELLARCGLSGADFGVLSRLVDLGRGEMRHQPLADSLGWEKSRLSHHVSRMRERELVDRRAGARAEVWIAITAAGRAQLAAARGVHAAAVRQHLLDKIPAGERDRQRLRTLLTELAVPA
jgi:DNA-binding MarR family transcriptional regulator